MFSLSNWLAGTNKTAGQRTLRVQRHAAAAWKRINDKPALDSEGNVGIRLKRDGVMLAAQVVRIDVDSSSSPASSEAGMGAARKLTIFGVRGHATVADTDVLKGDRVVIGPVEYTVMSVNEQLIGEVQAYAEAIS